ncbi:hypothetical protein MMC07_000593 [Pseudocyphellaria aurata]|nr:hypothetical protein [Pseudocyphellaria aurata]
MERRDELRTAATRRVAENNTRREQKDAALWSKPEVGDLVLVRDFQRDKDHGRKLDARWIGPRVIVGLTATGVAAFVRELYGVQAKRYHLNDLKVYLPRRERESRLHVHRTGMCLAGFPGQRAVNLHDLFQHSCH